jgi:choline dehydrogenase-like flavoprotein
MSGMTDIPRAVDAVVIGSGPGGAVTATRLAEAGKSVLVMEEGRDLQLESAPHFSREEILQKYRNAGINIAFGRSKIAYVEGCVVGGGSEINRGLYHRAPDSVLEVWRRKYKVAQLEYDDLTPHFEACESTSRVEYLPGQAPLISSLLAKGAESLGWSSMEVPRLYAYAKDHETGHFGRKQSMSATFIPRFLQVGGRLSALTRAIRLTRTSGRWTVSAVRQRDNGQSESVEVVAKSVFVACGAVQTPALLRRSGIKHCVGNTLRFHPMLKAVGVFRDEVNLSGDLEPVHQIKHFDPRFSMGCSVSKRPALALALASHPQVAATIGDEWRRMAIYYVQNTGGNGVVRNIPGFKDPFVRATQSEFDLVELAEGMRRLAEVLFAAGAETVYPSLPGYPALRSMADVRKLPETLSPARANCTALHLFSSCPMGEEESICAVNSFGKVQGTDSLYVADSSLLCTPTVVNPQGSVMAVAHRNVTHLLETTKI